MSVGTNREHPGHVKSWILNYPNGCNVALVLLVVAQWAVSTRYSEVNFLGPLAQSGDAVNTYLSMVEVAGVVAGFSAVVIVFGLQGGSTRLRRFRQIGGARLRRNWISAVSSPFLGVAVGVAASNVDSLGHTWFAVWLYEVVVLLLTHGAARLILVLAGLIRIVAAEDADFDQTARTLSSDVFFGATKESSNKN